MLFIFVSYQFKFLKEANYFSFVFTFMVKTKEKKFDGDIFVFDLDKIFFLGH